VIAHHSSLTRVAAPFAFLLAVTIAVLLVRSALSRDDEATGQRTGPARVETTDRPATQVGTTARAGQARFYEIQAGDTLETVAAEFDTTVEQLLVLNPDVDPVALGIGERIRVR
jgi:LysM repeat protein